MKKIVLYTPAMLNGSWFLASIDCAIWLSRKKDVNEIQIISFPINKILNPFQFFLKLKNFNYYFNKLFRRKHSSNMFEFPVSVSHDNLNEFMSAKTCELSINHNGLLIKFRTVQQQKSLFYLSDLFKNIGVTVQIYLRFFTKAKLRNYKYLNFKLDDYYPGLHVLSEAMRSDYSSYGSIFKSSFGILSAIYKLVATVNITKSISINADEEAFVCGPDQEYIYGAFSQLLCGRGATMIEMESMQEPFILQRQSKKYYTRPIIKHYPCLKDESTAASLIQNYFNDRVTAPWKLYWDIDFLKGVEHKSISQLIASSSKLTVIIYLHSFTDAQFVYGHDGYHDLEDWTRSTVRALFSNPNVGKIILKPHPGIDPTYHPGDVIANRRLRESLLHYKEKVVWADYHFNIHQLAEGGSCVAITHHGSVAEEASYFGIPLIASVYAPWGSDYVFGYIWHDKVQYEHLLRTLGKTRLEISDEHRKSLFNYVKDKDHSEVKSYSFNSSSTWLDFLAHFNVTKHHEFSVNMELIKRILLNINNDDMRFISYLNKRFDKISTLLRYEKDFHI